MSPQDRSSSPSPPPLASWRNPPWLIRVAVVALVTAMPGALLGASCALFVGDLPVCSFTGALIGMLFGMTLEAPSPPAQPPQDEAASDYPERFDVH